MIKAYFNILVMLLFSWGVYGYCQQDPTLPILVTVIVVMTLFARLSSSEKQYDVFEKIPLSVVIIISFLLGMFWRNVAPIPEAAHSPFPEFTAALQSGSVIGALLIWLRPMTQKNIYRLVFCAWLCVALAINVPFTEPMLIVFSSFCFVGVAIMILLTRARPANKKYLFAYARDFVVYSTLLIMFTTILFLGISRSIVAMEHAFFNTMSDYILPRNYTNFLRISSQLNLITPGVSGADRRPVMQVTLPKDTSGYLKMQVFEDYKNGTWTEPKDSPRTVLPGHLLPGQNVGKMMMFTFFKDLIPSPDGVIAVNSKQPYIRTVDGIVLAPGQMNMRIIDFSLTSQKEALVLSEEDFRRYTAVPPGIADKLKEIAGNIVNDSDDVKTKANKIAQYLRNNFSYSLDVSFSADDQGLIKMLEEKRPAYCTYFASALALLLRAEGIPARVAAGFYTNELIDRKNNTVLARVNNAHAWTEVYAPMTDPKTKKTIMLWRRLDATPVSFADEVSKKSAGFDLEAVFEKMWLNILRLSAELENVDKDQLKLMMITGLVMVMAFINRKDILAAVVAFVRQRRLPRQIVYKTPDALREVYGRYEALLRNKFGEGRRLADTDSDVLERIKQNNTESAALIQLMEEFIKEFHAVRFGSKPAERLPKIIDDIARAVRV